MYEFFRNCYLLLSSVFLCTLISCGTGEPELPRKPMPPFPAPSPRPDLPPGKDPERPDLPPRPEPVETCVNGQTYGIETRRYPGRGIYMAAKCDGYKPLVVGNNGTGAPSMYYQGTIRYLASKGYMVIWPENPNTGNGRTCMAALEFGFKQPDVFPEHYAITGHSQGGSATLACGGLAERKWPNYKAALLPNESACGMSAGNIRTLAGLIDQKVLFFAGDRDSVVPLSWVMQCYNYVKADKALVIGKGATHFNTQNYIPELALGFFNGALLNQLEGWEMLNQLSPRKYKWKEQFEDIGDGIGRIL